MKTEIFNLKQGAKVLFNRQKEVNGISIAFNFTAGAFNDKKNKLGIAHFCEHALCAFPNAKMSREERVGYKRKFSYFNARTSSNNMIFEVDVTEEDFEDAIDFLTEQFYSIKLTDEEVEKERKIIDDEIKTRVLTNSREYLFTSRQEIIKDEHYKNMISSPAGTRETLERITVDDLKEFIKTYLTLNNLCVTICGNISKRRVKRAMHKFVETRIGHSDKQGYLSRESNKLFAPKYHFKKSVEDGKALFVCLYNIKHIPWSYDVDREWVVSNVLSMIMQEYAFSYFREKKSLCYGCSLCICSVSNYFSNEFYVECQEENLDDIIGCYGEFLKQLPENIEKEIFEKHKRKRILQYDFDFIKISKICELMYSVYLNDNKLYNTRYRKQILKERKSITYEEVNDLYKTLFSVKPHVAIMSNKEEYKDFDYKSFCKTVKK